MSMPKVLVVDDEPGVLGLVADALSILGYEVHAVSSPGQALEVVKAAPCFDLLVSDVIMPEMCGPELVRKVAELCPAISILIMSASIDRSELPASAGFISKPFLLADLYSIVEKTLNRGSVTTEL
jgi:CheY-like chemotaxis protein